MPEDVKIRVWGVKQELSAGNDFSDVLPTTTPAISDPMKQFRFPVDAQGGRIDFEGRLDPIAVRQIALELLGNQTWWKVWWFDGEDNYLQSEGTTESYWIWAGERICLPGQYMWVETAGASADVKQINAIWADVEIV